MNVPFLDLKASYLELKAELDSAYMKVMESGWFILGAELEAFESNFANYCNGKHCIGTGNGLEALHLILRALGIGAGDEVIVPANTFIATWLAVSYAGATPVPVEPNMNSYNLDPDLIESAITPNTKAIIPVHLYGQPADIDPMMEVAEKFGIRIIEDAAQAHGALYRHKRCGSLGHAAAFSFYPGKNLGAHGDGGAIVTDDDALAKQIRSLRNYGSEIKYYHDKKGYNSRLDDLQAAFLNVKLEHLDEWNLRRTKIASHYLKELNDIDQIQLPYVPHSVNPVWHLFPILAYDRDSLQEFLKQNGVGTLIHYPVPPHLSRAYLEMGMPVGTFPITENIANTELSLPIGPHMSLQEAEFVIDLIRKFYQNR